MVIDGEISMGGYLFIEGFLKVVSQKVFSNTGRFGKMVTDSWLSK